MVTEKEFQREKLRREYAELREAYQARGISEAEYLRSRMVDLGLEPLIEAANAEIGALQSARDVTTRK
ncbi:MAG: hypothetical protein K1X71_08140 [Pirellulales bacterium]|nr:hypothetical protein [Pirellulales bacterium]